MKTPTKYIIDELSHRGIHLSEDFAGEFLEYEEMYNKNKEQNEHAELKRLVANLGWDTDRFSSSGTIYYEEICKILNI